MRQLKDHNNSVPSMLATHPFPHATVAAKSSMASRTLPTREGAFDASDRLRTKCMHECVSPEKTMPYTVRISDS